MEQEIIQIKKQLDKIMDNELVHIKGDMMDIRNEMSVISTNQEWIMKFFWIIATSSVGGFIAGILGLVLNR